jgi:hypothetical protein
MGYSEDRKRKIELEKEMRADYRRMFRKNKEK